MFFEKIEDSFESNDHVNALYFFRAYELFKIDIKEEENLCYGSKAGTLGICLKCTAYHTKNCTRSEERDYKEIAVVCQ